MFGIDDVEMKPKWIKAGRTNKDIFDIIKEIENGNTIAEISQKHNVSMYEIRNLLMRTRSYLQNHLILDSYLEMARDIERILPDRLKLEWTTSEISELVELKISGATIQNIAQIMRKTEDESNRQYIRDA